MFSLIRKIKCLSGLFLLFASLSACGLSGGSVSGKVIDKSTGHPIEGAIVVARWKGDVMNPVDSRTKCFHVESTTTDKEGKFHIPFWVGFPQGIVNQDVYIRAYKEGYREVIYKDTQEAGYKPAPKGVEHLISFAGTREERLEYLLKTLERTRCPSAGKSTRNLYQLYNALYEEADSLAITEKEKEFARGFKGRALSIRKSTGKNHEETYKP